MTTTNNIIRHTASVCIFNNKKNAPGNKSVCVIINLHKHLAFAQD